MQEIGPEAAAAAQRRPALRMWGFFLHTLHSAPAEEREGQFFWFADEVEGLLFVREKLAPWITAEIPVRRAHRVELTIKALADQYAERALSAEDFAFRIARTLWPFGVEFAWCGTLGDLMAGPGAFPRKIRRYYRVILADIEEPGVSPDDETPVPAEEELPFVEITSNFGLEGEGL